jgi:4-hydroxybenzoate polyprenyltransferase
MNIKALLYLGFPIALSSSSLCLVVSAIFAGTYPPELFTTVFLITYGIYGMDRILGVGPDSVSHPERTRFFREFRGPICFSIALSFIFGFVISLFSSLFAAALVPVTLLVPVLYSSRMLGKGESAIKKVLGLKDLFIAAGWTALCPFTLIFINMTFNWILVLFSIPLFLKLVVMATVYDFKDMASDRASGTRTFPVVIGVGPTRLLLHLMNGVATVIFIVMIPLGFIAPLSWVFVPGFVYQIVLIQLSSEDAPDWVYYVLCDLEQFIWLLLIFPTGWLVGAF